MSEVGKARSAERKVFYGAAILSMCIFTSLDSASIRPQWKRTEFLSISVGPFLLKSDIGLS